jgi:E3 ubiquitin-protein ligase synoviolin
VILLGLQKLLYGPLRPIEIEQLYERAWLFVTETCLSMTIFRGSFGAWFMVMFFSLLAGKVWSWIGEGRVEILEQQPPANPRLFHTRLAISLSLSVLFATYMLEYSIRTVLAQAKPDMMVMFGFEFAILSILSISTAARYTICLTEIYIVRQQKTARLNELRAERSAAGEASRVASQEISSSTTNQQSATAEVDEADLDVEGWDGKGRWIFYLDLVTGK